MKKLSTKFTLAALLLCFNAYSQSKIFDNVVDVEVRSTVEITNNKQIVGYAFFYQIDKMRKSAMFRLSILDENLKEIGSNEFEGPKDLLLTRAVYESNHIFLAFYDKDKKEGYARFVKIFDLKGKETGNVSYDPEKVKKGMFGAAIAQQMEAIYEGTDNVEGKGCVTIHQSKAKVGGVDVQMIDVNGKLKWEQSISGEKGDRSDLYLVSTTPNAILLFEMDRGSVMNRDADLFMVGLSTDNGRQLFKTPMDINGTSYEPMLVKMGTDGKLKIVSSMYDGSSKFLSAKPVGFSIANLNDLTGKIDIVKDFGFAKDLGNVLDMKNESKSEDGYIKAHNVIMLPDGGMIVVGEFFRKTVSAGGMAMKILSRGNASASQATIEDMFLLRINSNLKATALEKIEKGKERYPLPTDGLPIGLVARLLTYEHDFGYMYTDEGMDGSKKTVLARGSFGEEKYGTVALTVDDKKGYTTKRFNLQKEKHITYHIVRGKPGYVMIIKYDSKAKTMSVNLEKVS